MNVQYNLEKRGILGGAIPDAVSRFYSLKIEMLHWMLNINFDDEMFISLRQHNREVRSL
jgi:hypothetical protein